MTESLELLFEALKLKNGKVEDCQWECVASLHLFRQTFRTVAVPVVELTSKR